MTVQEWLGEGNKLGIDIWEKKYRYNGESFDEWVERVSDGNTAIAKLIRERKFLPAGRILSNMNVDCERVTLSNCYVIAPPEDNLESIYDSRKKLARTYSYGGGCGIDLSRLAPKGAKVNNQAKYSTGAVSFMEGYSAVTAEIGQNGRRGALMLSLSCEHPDLLDFINAKTNDSKITKANLSVRVTDEFMQAVEDDAYWGMEFTRPESGETLTEVLPAREIFRQLCEANWDWGEPGMLFWDKIKNYNLLSNDPEFELAGVNPCVTGDTKIFTRDDEYVEIEKLVDQEVVIWNGYDWSLVTPSITGRDQPIIRVRTSNGLEVKCTPYHTFILKNGKRVTASQLKKGWTLHDYFIPVRRNDGGFMKCEDIKIEEIIDEGEIAEKVYCVNEPKNHSAVFNGMLTGNCSEAPLPAGGACLLGSINLAEFVMPVDDDSCFFNYKLFGDAVGHGVRYLNNVLDKGLDSHPLDEQKEAVAYWRQIGLGVMGLADCLIKLGYTYGSQEAVRFCQDVASAMLSSAKQASAFYSYGCAGPFPGFSSEYVSSSEFWTSHFDEKCKGLRNGQLLSIAPTGSISTMLGVSGGIEPIFATSYTRKTESLDGVAEPTYYKVYTPIVKEYMDKHGLEDESQLPEYFITAPEVPYEQRIEMQAAWQKYVDAAISSTINLPHDATIEDVGKIYMLAWKKGLKGITVFRDGCKRVGVLTTQSDSESEPEAAEENDVPKCRSIKACSDDLIGRKRKLTTGCGSLHCLAYFDPDTGDLQEVYLNKGSTGGCVNFMTGLSRTISLLCRAGVSVEDISDQLESTGVCPSYNARRVVGHDTSTGACCPMAIGRALVEMEHTLKEELGKVSERKNVIVETCDAMHEPCPECGAPVLYENGCQVCKNCGYSKCS